ncbi:putative pentatricopeptide repeat-containing protein [Acorus gramineus]|uniref:Pentatricopeptide repeat-containing protein n=1 Tax=Acorus gramineus TaxID=55184 RepID=A0AAV9BEM4_ACOGR|nr:putative pentatricopeptide repeat-containing protein [Acorus gramineus]
MTIQHMLKRIANEAEIETALDGCEIPMSEELVLQVLRRHRSDWKLALAFFNWSSARQRHSHGPKPYNEMLDILGRMRQLDSMRGLLDSIPKSNHPINERTFSIVVNRYCAAHKVDEAIELFHNRPQYGLPLDLIAFQTLLTCLCRYKHVEVAESLFVEKQHEFPPVIKTRNIILHGWCVVGSAREAKRFWNDIVVSGCKPDLITYGTIINSMAKAGKLGTAVKLFTSMWRKGCEPDATICNCIIDALCFKKRVPEALEVFAEMDGKGCTPNTVTYNCLIKHLCRIRRLEKAYGLLEEMEAKGCEADARTYGYFIKCARSTEEFGEVLERMRRSGCRMTGDAYNMVLKMHVGWGDFGAAERVWEEMEREGLGPDQRSYTVMVHGLCERRRMGEALRYFEEMKEKGMVPEKRTNLVVKAINLKLQNSEARSSLGEGEVELNEGSVSGKKPRPAHKKM